MPSRVRIAVVLAIAACTVDRPAQQPATVATAAQQAEPQPEPQPEPVRPMSPCQKHPRSLALKWQLAGDHCARVSVEVACGSTQPPPGTFNTAADCDAASHVTTPFAVVTLMTASGELARANDSRNAPPTCASLGLRAGSTCAAKDYGAVCASTGASIEYLACVLPDASELSAGHASDGNICYGMCNTGRGTATSLGAGALGAPCSPFTLCGAPPPRGM